MNASEIAKDAIRLATTHGLSKDVIDLMEKKLALLTENMTFLSDENKTLKAENMNLSYKLAEFNKKAVGMAQLPDGFDETTDQIIISMFASSDESTMEALSFALKLPMGMIQFHFDIMMRHSFVRKTYPGVRLGSNYQPARYVLDSAGLRYAATKKSS